eukprot:m51a1_g10749 hypothetical protein (659) ;mRNA; f:357421-359956
MSAGWAGAIAPLALECAAVAVGASVLAGGRGGRRWAAQGPAAVRVPFGEATQGGLLVALALREHRVRSLFTLPADSIAPVNAAASSLGIRVVDVRGEATAVFAAEGHYRLTGDPGVAVLANGPGLAAAAPGIANALASRSAVVLLAGAPSAYAEGRGQAQSHPDAAQALSALCKSSQRVGTVGAIGPAVAWAFAEALSGVPGPVLLAFPSDVLFSLRELQSSVAAMYPRRVLLPPLAGVLLGLRSQELPFVKRYLLDRHVRRVFSVVGSDVEVPPPLPVDVPQPSQSDLDEAVRAIVGAQRPVMVVGPQAAVVMPPARATENNRAVEEAAALIGVPTCLVGSARGLLGPDSALEVRHAARSVLRRADAVVLVGVALDQRLGYGAALDPACALVSCSRCPQDLALNARAHRPAAPARVLGCHADPVLFVQALARRLQRSGSASARPDLRWWRSEVAQLDEAERARLDAAGAAGAGAVARAVAGAMARAAPHSVVVLDGAGPLCGAVEASLRARGPHCWLDALPYGTPGCGAGFALAAALARPGADVLLVWGEGACGCGLAELSTLARHGVGVVAVVGSSGARGAAEGSGAAACVGEGAGRRAPRCAYDEVAVALGAGGRRLQAASPDELREALEDALAQARAKSLPVLLDVALGQTEPV